MKKKIILVLLICTSMLLLSTEKYPLKTDFAPQALAVGNGNLYFSCNFKIFVYSLKTKSIVKTFGRKGEGPGEFINIYDDFHMFLSIHNQNLVVNSQSKVSYYSEMNEMIKEKRVNNGYQFLDINDKWVGIKRININNTAYNAVSLYDKSFKIQKTLFKKKHWYQPGKSVDPIGAVRPAMYHIYDGAVFVQDDTDNISIYSGTGKIIGKTDVKFDSRKITDNDKSEYHHFYKTHPKYKTAYNTVKNLFVFPKTFPEIKYFDVADSKIYVFTFIEKEGKSELYIFDTKGKLQKKTYLDCPKIDPKILYPVMKIKNNMLYQIIENDEDEEVDLFVTKIEI